MKIVIAYNIYKKEVRTPINKHKKRNGDKTPLLDTTNQSSKQASARSTRSIRSFGRNTPMSLRKIMSKTFKRTKDKSNKKQLGDTTATVKGDNTVVSAPKKKLKL